MFVIDSTAYVDRRLVRPSANITLKETLEEPRQRLGNGGGLFRDTWVNSWEGLFFWGDGSKVYMTLGQIDPSEC